MDICAPAFALRIAMKRSTAAAHAPADFDRSLIDYTSGRLCPRPRYIDKQTAGC
jgi:hypothetical protein